MWFSSKKSLIRQEKELNAIQPGGRTLAPATSDIERQHLGWLLYTLARACMGCERAFSDPRGAACSFALSLPRVPLRPCMRAYVWSNDNDDKNLCAAKAIDNT